MKSKVRIVGILVLAVLSFGACNKASDEQSGQNPAQEKSAAQPPGRSDSSID